MKLTPRIVLVVLSAATGLMAQTMPSCFEEHAQNGVRPEIVPDLVGGARRTLCAFEVAAIRPFDRTNQMGHGSVAVSGPRVTFTGYTLSALILYAYDLKPYQLSGAPFWIGQDAYSITAKAEGDAAPATPQVRKMLQSLLADRFSLVAHHETKEEKVYLLSQGKEQILKPSTAPRTTMKMAPGHMMMAKVGTAQWVTLLSTVLGRPVLDQTGLTGEFDFTLDSPDIAMGNMPAASGEEASGPSIFTAIQEQQGLKLTLGKGPIDTLVVDKVSKPVEN